MVTQAHEPFSLICRFFRSGIKVTALIGFGSWKNTVVFFKGTRSSMTEAIPRRIGLPK